ncbi:hypothetical protein, partial [Bowmanella yangjiangensis]
PGKAGFSNNRGIWTLGLFWALLACLTMLLVDARGDDDWPMALVGLAFSLAFAVASLIMFTLALHQPSFGKKLGVGFGALMFFWPVPMGLLMIAEVTSWAAILLIALYLLLLVVSYILLPAPTLLGRRLLDGLEGYRDYLQLAERDVLAL